MELITTGFALLYDIAFVLLEDLVVKLGILNSVLLVLLHVVAIKAFYDNAGVAEARG